MGISVVGVSAGGASVGVASTVGDSTGVGVAASSFSVPKIFGPKVTAATMAMMQRNAAIPTTGHSQRGGRRFAGAVQRAVEVQPVSGRRPGAVMAVAVGPVVGCRPAASVAG